jgi:hypothetical protein
MMTEARDVMSNRVVIDVGEVDTNGGQSSDVVN